MFTIAVTSDLTIAKPFKEYKSFLKFFMFLFMDKWCIITLYFWRIHDKKHNFQLQKESGKI